MQIDYSVLYQTSQSFVDYFASKIEHSLNIVCHLCDAQFSQPLPSETKHAGQLLDTMPPVTDSIFRINSKLAKPFQNGYFPHSFKTAL